MAARKDDSQQPPEGGRRAVIWRLPSTQGSGEGRPAAAAPDPHRPGGRRVPLAAVLGLAAALVCVGLYAVWETVGRDMMSASGDPEAIVTPAATTLPADGAAGDATAAAPPGNSGSTPLVVAEEGGEDDATADRAAGTATVVAAEERLADNEEAVIRGGQSTEAAQEDDAVPGATGPDMDEPPSSPALADDDPRIPSPVKSAQDEKAPHGAAFADGNAVGTDVVGPDALDTLEARLQAVEVQAAGAAAADTVAMALEQRLRALEEDPTREPLGRALAAWGEQRAELEAALGEMSTRLAHLEAEAARQAAADGRLVGLVLATGELTAALGSSRPFAQALNSLHGIAGDDPQIGDMLASLAPFAATGVPTLDALRARFPEAANAVVRAATGSDDADWIDETVTKLSQLVTIRRTGGALDPGSVDGRLVEAEAALAAGDLARAIALVEGLLPDAAGDGSAQAWLRDARARRDVDDALASLVATLHGRIGERWVATGARP